MARGHFKSYTGGGTTTASSLTTYDDCVHFTKFLRGFNFHERRLVKYQQDCAHLDLFDLNSNSLIFLHDSLFHTFRKFSHFQNFMYVVKIP